MLVHKECSTKELRRLGEGWWRKKRRTRDRHVRSKDDLRHPCDSLAPLKSKLDSNYSKPKDDFDEVQEMLS